MSDANVIQLPEGEMKRALVAEIRERIAAGKLEELSLGRLAERVVDLVRSGDFWCPACGCTLLLGGIDRREPYLCCIGCWTGVFARGDLAAHMGMR